MDLSNIVVPADLKIAPIVTCTIEGHLEEDDLRELMLSRGAEPIAEEKEDPADLKRIREKHHSVARMVAGGLTQRMVAQLCGYDEHYLSVLLNNPSMRELVELYRIQAGAAAQVVTERLRTVGLRAVEKLETAIEENTLNNQELLGVAKLGLDRGGHGPQSKQHVVNEQHLFDHTELQRRNQEAVARNSSRIVSSQHVRAQLAPPAKEQIVEADRNVGAETSAVDEDRSQQRLQSDRE